MSIYRGLSEKAQKNTVRGNWNIIRSYNMRKYFNSALLNAGADIFFTEFLMGHTLDPTKAAHFFANPEQLEETIQSISLISHISTPLLDKT
jgi:integrase